jgi:hypothetical protein
MENIICLGWMILLLYFSHLNFGEFFLCPSTAETHMLNGWGFAVFESPIAQHFFKRYSNWCNYLEGKFSSNVEIWEKTSIWKKWKAVKADPAWRSNEEKWWPGGEWEVADQRRLKKGNFFSLKYKYFSAKRSLF